MDREVWTRKDTRMINQLALRDYQEDAITAVMKAWLGGMKRPAVVLPTGSGKTVIFSHIAKAWHNGAQQRERVVILVHRDELVNQTVAKLSMVAPTLKTGVIKADRNDVLAQVIVASIQTLSKTARLEQVHHVGLVIVDEAHHAAADSYVSVMDHFDRQGSIFAGFTATLVRDDKRELGKVWNDVVYQRDILDLIPKYLADVKGQLVEIDGMSLNKAKLTKGDFTDVSLADLLLENDAQTIVADAYAKHAPGKQGIIFAPTVKAAQVFAASFNEKGIKTEAVWGAMDVEDRRLVIKKFTTGEVQVIANCMVMTEGTDLPMAEVAVIARPTKSAGLYIQMVGRVLRPWPGKSHALVLDVVGASEDHTLATLADLSSNRIDKVEPGESLTGAAKRLAKKGVAALRGYVGYKDVDLFNRSVSLWQTTDAGIYFISTPCTEGSCEFNVDRCRTHLIFLWPSGDMEHFNVGILPQEGRGGRWIREGLDLPEAMEWAEQSAGKNALTNRKSTWRRKNEPATPAQKNFAYRLGIELTGDETKPQLSDMITVRLASRRLDSKLKKG